jgi:hypothetical protein
MIKPTEKKGADYAREGIASTAKETKSLEARKKLCELIAKHGNYDDEGKALWAEYLAQGCPAS